MNYQEGDEVRHLPTDTVGYIFDINPDPDYDPEDETYGSLHSDPRAFHGDFLLEIERPGDLELIRRAADIPAPKLPTINELVAFAQFALLEDYDQLTVTETDRTGEPEGQFVAYGVKDDHCRFGFRVTISEVEVVDE